MGLHALEGTGHPLPLRCHRSGIRLLCGNRGACPEMVAGTQSGMAVPADQGTATDVETVHHRKHAVPDQHRKREILNHIIKCQKNIVTL